jgi:hypothetical protein
MEQRRSDVKDYAEEICEEVNHFISTDEFEVIISGITSESESESESDTTRVSLSLVPLGTEDISDVNYSSPEYEYTVDDAGEEVTFACPR